MILINEPKIELYEGDCIDIMKSMPDNSEDLCEKTHRKFIIDSCIELLQKCDEVWFIKVNGELSKGQKSEWECAMFCQMPFDIIEEA